MTPIDEDIVFALRDIPAVEAVFALPGGEDGFLYMVVLLPYRTRDIAAAHYRLRAAVGGVLAARVWYCDGATSPPKALERATRLVLDERARAAASSRADERRAAGTDEQEPDPLDEFRRARDTASRAPRWLVFLRDRRAIEILEATGSELVVAHDPRRPDAERVSLVEAASEGPFTLVIADDYRFTRDFVLLRDTPVLLFRPTGFAPSPVANTYDELRNAVAALARPSTSAPSDVAQSQDERSANIPVRSGTPRHVLDGLFPSGHGFLERIDDLCAALPTLIGIPRERLDGTWKSLELIDDVCRMLAMKARFDPALFESIVAYAGEILRRHVEGIWVPSVPDGTSVFEPRIRDAHGRLYAPAMVVFDELDENDGEGGISIAGALEGEAMPLLGSRPKLN